MSYRKVYRFFVFQDVLDFTVGWYTELDQPAEVGEKCNQVLLELRPYFHQAIPSSVELMTQFVDDAKVYIEVRFLHCYVDCFIIAF